MDYKGHTYSQSLTSIQTANAKCFQVKVLIIQKAANCQQGRAMLESLSGDMVCNMVCDAYMRHQAKMSIMFI